MSALGLVAVKRGFACIGVHQPKLANNIGSVLRACGCYKADDRAPKQQHAMTPPAPNDTPASPGSYSVVWITGVQEQVEVSRNSRGELVMNFADSPQTYRVGDGRGATWTKLP